MLLVVLFGNTSEVANRIFLEIDMKKGILFTYMISAPSTTSLYRLIIVMGIFVILACTCSPVLRTVLPLSEAKDLVLAYNERSFVMQGLLDGTKPLVLPTFYVESKEDRRGTGKVRVATDCDVIKNVALKRKSSNRNRLRDPQELLG